MNSPFPWWYATGAQLDENGAHFRVWANGRRSVSVVVDGKEHPLSGDPSGYFSGYVAGAADGDAYTFQVDGKGPLPDPASRFQPRGPHGPSQIVDASKFNWTDGSWRGIKLEGQIVYEMHVGTFTTAGTWQAAAQQLSALADLGVTVLEVMPVADFTGEFGWGYDGVNLFAPTRNYGTPDDFREFVDRAHALKLAVILDVVYNHLGPDGNYLPQFSEAYFTKEHETDWGAATNFYGEHSEPVREFYLCNAAFWIKEFHLDGLRLDATQNIYDHSKDHILAAIGRAARKAGEGRGVILVGENEPQEARLIRSQAEGGYGMDALWNDDFHHSATVAATGKREAYYMDYLGTAQELMSAVKYGFLYQGQWYAWQKKRRGTPTFGTKPAAMVAFLQNHDQVANSARGLRLHELTTPGIYKTLTALTLLAPSTPMLFQGQEFAASTRFLYFADHKTELAKQVLQGRADFLSQWRSLALGEVGYDDPSSRSTFEKCKLDFAERKSHGETYALHKDLLQLRKAEKVFARQDRNFDGAVLAPDAFVLRFFCEDHKDDRLLVVNLGRDLVFNPAPEPLLAPPEQGAWSVLWSSDSAKYGGNGTPALDSDLNWIIPAQCAVVLQPIAALKPTATLDTIVTVHAGNQATKKATSQTTNQTTKGGSGNS
jgi:maltooligosyltrehalose trehalohydrolase